MSDYIDRQAAIDAVCEHGTDLERRGITVLAVANHKQVTIDLLESLPSVQPEKQATTFPVDGEPLDCISRQQAILCIERNAYRREDINETEHIIKWVLDIIKWLPSEQPEVIRCEDCKWRRNRNGTMAWIPCRALVTPDDFYCKYAERKEQ